MMLTCPALLCPCSCTYHVTMPLAAACSTSLWPSQLHAVRCCGLHSCMQYVTMPLMATHTTSPCPHGCTHHVAVPLMAACTVSLCPSRLHAARCCALRSGTQHVAALFVAACSMLLCPLRLHTPCRCAPFAGLPSALDQTHMGSYILMLNSSQLVFLLFYLEYICISQHLPVVHMHLCHIYMLPEFHHVVAPWPLSCGFNLASSIFPVQSETGIGDRTLKDIDWQYFGVMGIKFECGMIFKDSIF